MLSLGQYVFDHSRAEMALVRSTWQSFSGMAKILDYNTAKGEGSETDKEWCLLVLLNVFLKLLWNIVSVQAIHILALHLMIQPYTLQNSHLCASSAGSPANTGPFASSSEDFHPFLFLH